MQSFKRLSKLLAVMASLAVLPIGASAQTITAAMAAPAGTVNTNDPGFNMYIVQGNSRLAMSAFAPAQALITGTAIDPNTKLPFDNIATPNTDGTFNYYLPTYINMHEQAPSGATGGNFSTAAAAPMNIADDPEPGIPGTTGSGDYFAMEFTGYLQLPSGTVRFGVNSDDGFKLTVGNGVNPRDPGALQLIILDGTRGFGNTEANITVSTAGIYPFRLLFWENAGANSGVELYTFAPGTTSGNRYLVNDRNQANSIKSYRSLLITPSLLTAAIPSGGATGVAPSPKITVQLTDGQSAVNPASIKQILDGVTVSPAITKAGKVTSLVYLAPVAPPSSVHTNTIIFADAAGTYTNTWTYTTAAYTPVPASWSLPSVDATKPGFNVKMYQMEIVRNPATGVVPNAERQIARGYIDSSTGQPYANTADLSLADADGFLVETDFVNWNQDAPAAVGNFSSASNPPSEDKFIPGIPGSSSTPTDRLVASIETILQLKAGPYRFGVNSDDGFRMSFGRGPGDVIGIQYGTAGDRGSADTLMDVVITADGNYPVRVMWWESGGGANCEFFTENLLTGERTLINDLSAATPIKAYRASAASRPWVSRVLPAVNYRYAFADDDFVVEITDGAIPLTAGSVRLQLNGSDVAGATAAKNGKITTVTRKGSVANLLPSGTVSANIIYDYTEGGNTVTVTNTYSFLVPAYTVPIPIANKVPRSQVSGSGFHVVSKQIDRSQTANQGNGGRYTAGTGNSGNLMPRAEIEFADGYINPTTGLPYPNLAARGPNADGSWDVPEVLNFNHSTTAGAGGPAANAGIFNGDGQVPGLPGTGTSNQGLDNSVHEITAYLDLKAGAHLFGLNVDDGWTAISGPNVHDTLGTYLGARLAPGGQNGNPLNNPNAAFNVIVPEDGIYPFRILFWEGGGGVNLEFLEVDRQTGTQILVNDVGGVYPSTTGGVLPLPSQTVAYNTYTGPVKPWVKFSVYPLQGSTNTAVFQNQHQQGGPGPINVKVGAGNPADVSNWTPVSTYPFGDAVGAIVANLGTDSVGMIVDGTNVTSALSVTSVPNSTDKKVLYTPNPPFASGSSHTAGLIYAGSTNWWSFRVITNVTVPVTAAIPSSAADANARGFKLKITQASANLANTVARAEAQLAGSPTNIAPRGPNADGSFTLTNIINLNQTKNLGSATENGGFTTALTGQADEAIPGVTGTALNFTGEITAYLDLSAGYQKFGINGDDGWVVKLGTSGETNGLVLFTIDRGAGAADIPFAFITPQAGLYPIRIVWYQGTGGGNLEFFTYGPDNERIPVNANRPDAVKAYYNVNQVITPTISITRGAGGLSITYVGKLQRAASLASPVAWTDVTGATSPFTVSTAAGEGYWRTVSP